MSPTSPTGDAPAGGNTAPRAPIPNAYWIPGTRILAGEYPGSLDHRAARAKIRRLLEARVICFVDLTHAHELQPYERLLRAEAAGLAREVEHVRLPIADMGVPTTRDMARILDTIDAAVAAGRTVYVHCWGGVGRTGTVVGCWLVRHGLDGEAALARVGALFGGMSAAKRLRHPEGSPQTTGQRDFVRSWRERAREDVGGPRTPPRRSTRAPLSARDRLRGALVGLAVGDAVGTTVEFRPPGSFAPVTDMVGGGPFGLAPGQWTDDTAMALCLAESLIECRAFDAADQMRRYVRWWREGHRSSTGRCFDIGTTTRRALAAFERTGDPYSGPEAPDTAGNGSLMRLAPLAIFARRFDAAFRAFADGSRTTHGARVAVDACRYLGALLLGAFAGACKAELLAPHYTPLAGYWDAHPLCPEVAAIADGSFRRKQPPAIRGTGYAAASLEAALWAFHASATFREGCLLAVNLGDDADTTAAVYGQLAGAFYGEQAIPAEWRERLALWPVIDEYAEALYRLSEPDAPRRAPAPSGRPLRRMD